MTRRRRRGWILLGLAGAAACGVALLYGHVEPQSDIGLAMSRVRYALSLDEGAALRAYGRQLGSVNGGYCPAAAEEFLVGRFLEPTSDREREAVLRFFVSRPGRASDRLAATGRRGLEILVPLLGCGIDADQRELLRLAEAMRVGTYQGKFSSLRGDVSLTEVSAAYERWWSSGLPWEQQGAIDPLADLAVAWVHGP